jgi:hypothetical protein
MRIQREDFVKENKGFVESNSYVDVANSKWPNPTTYTEYMPHNLGYAI